MTQTAAPFTPTLIEKSLSIGDRTLRVANFQSDTLINTSLDDSGGWEPWQLNLLSRIIKDDSTCVDIGANIGLNSLFMATRCPRGKVYSFEPFRQIYDCLKRNVEQNNFTNIVPINK